LSAKEQEKLKKILDNPSFVLLKETYEAKESFRAILEEEITPEEADKKLTNWVIEVMEKNNKYLNKFIKTFTKWYDYILNYFDGRWSNGMVEGINNRIKMIKRRAFGYHDFESFRNRVLVEFL